MTADTSDNDDAPVTTDTALNEPDAPADEHPDVSLIGHISYTSGYETTKLFDTWDEAFEYLSDSDMVEQAGGMRSVEIEFIDAEDQS